MMRTDECITDAERVALRDALGFDDARIDHAVEWARQAGYDRGEFAGVILDAAMPSMDGKRGPKPQDALRAAIFKGSPFDNARFGRGLQSNLRAAGVAGIDAPTTWADVVMRKRPLSIRALAMECLADAVDAAAIKAGQGSFVGSDWAVPDAEFNDVDEATERDEEPEGEPA